MDHKRTACLKNKIKDKKLIKSLSVLTAKTMYLKNYALI